MINFLMKAEPSGIFGLIDKIGTQYPLFALVVGILMWFINKLWKERDGLHALLLDNATKYQEVLVDVMQALSSDQEHRSKVVVIMNEISSWRKNIEDIDSLKESMAKMNTEADKILEELKRRNRNEDRN